MTGPSPWAHLEERLEQVRLDEAVLAAASQDVTDFNTMRAELLDPASPEHRDAVAAYNRAHRCLFGQK